MFGRFARFMLFREDWCVGVVSQSAEDIARNGLTGPVRWLAPAHPGTGLADPACHIRPDGNLTLYAEYINYETSRGEIWSAELKPGDDPSRATFEPMLSQSHHMSYPFVFYDDSGHWMLTAETCEANYAALWRNDGCGWYSAGTLFPNRPVVDPTLWRGPDRWWLFCTFQDDSPNGRLHLFHTLRLGDDWIPHRCNPVRNDLGVSRPAGPLFTVGNLLVRPAQDCSRTYGGGIVLNSILKIDPDVFVEEPIRHLRPVTGRFPHGLHTLCPAGSVTFVDGKRLCLDLRGIQGRLTARFAHRLSHDARRPAASRTASEPGQIRRAP